MKIIAAKEVYRCKVFTVTEEHAHDADGFEIQRSIVHHPGSAVVMAVDAKQRVLLVRQFRLPAAKNLWEIPAGKLDEGETPLKAARRELAEETGLRARKWTKLASFWASPGFLAEKMTLFLATDLVEGPQQLMEDERIECRWFGRKELEELIRAGKIEDGKTLIGFWSWRARGKRVGSRPAGGKRTG